MKTFFLVLVLQFISFKIFAQKDLESELPFKTTLKINVNGLKAGIEQKIFRKTTVQLEAGYLGRYSFTISPQIRQYFIIPDFPFYLGVGYLYKTGEYNMSDSVRLRGTIEHYWKRFHIHKHIHVITINGGYFDEETIFKRTIRFEYSLGTGIRFKKSTRSGLLSNEEIDNSESYIITPQKEEDTKGKFKLYPEFNIIFRLIIPLRR